MTTLHTRFYTYVITEGHHGDERYSPKAAVNTMPAGVCALGWGGEARRHLQHLTASSVEFKAVDTMCYASLNAAFSAKTATANLSTPPLVSNSYANYLKQFL